MAISFFSWYFKSNYFIEVQLTYNVLVSVIQQSDSVMHIHTFSSICFSIMVCHRIMNIVPCAIQ